MGERKRIGLVYNYSEKWIAGSYYILNIIKALNHLPDEEKPVLVIFTRERNGLQYVEEINYPRLSFYFYKIFTNPFAVAINKVARLAGLGNLVYDHNPAKLVSSLYPSHWNISGFKKNYFWIPDFQEDYYPQYFTPQEVAQRKKGQLAISRSRDVVVFSSADARNDFTRLYPGHTCTLKVLNFASVLSNSYQKKSIEQLLVKFGIQTPYLIAPNQFWQHKNHLLILKAVNELKQKGLSYTILFTGNEHDYRNKEYVTTLKKYCSDNGIEKYILFLGFIDRDEQLQLINHSVAVVQPSLFEGWSTVVEDAKALNKYLILSDLPVHTEQAKYNVSFFDRTSHTDLARKIEEVIVAAPPEVKKNYDDHIDKFGREFLEIFN